MIHTKAANGLAAFVISGYPTVLKDPSMIGHRSADPTIIGIPGSAIAAPARSKLDSVTPSTK